MPTSSQLELDEQLIEWDHLYMPVNTDDDCDGYVYNAAADDSVDHSGNNSAVSTSQNYNIAKDDVFSVFREDNVRFIKRNCNVDKIGSESQEITLQAEICSCREGPHCCTEAICTNVERNISCDNSCGKDSCKNSNFFDETKFELFRIMNDNEKGKIVFASKGFKKSSFIMQYTGLIVPPFDPRKHAWNW